MRVFVIVVSYDLDVSSLFILIFLCLINSVCRKFNIIISNIILSFKSNYNVLRLQILILNFIKFISLIIPQHSTFTNLINFEAMFSFRIPPGMKREKAMKLQLLRVTVLNFAIWGLFFGLLEYGGPCWNYALDALSPKIYIEPIFLLDVRDATCKERMPNYDVKSGQGVSIIMPYLNESWFQANKTIRSILQTTPPQLLHEILLIDDGNEPGSEEFDWGARAMEIEPEKIKVHRNEQREGLIRSKNLGAALSSSSTLVFLEPHMIFNPGWLEPLLDALEDGHTIVTPHLDGLLDRYFKRGLEGYMIRPYTIGGFDFSFTFNWFATPDRRDPNWESPDNFYSPAFSGGVFAIRKEEFNRFGGFDHGMRDWGGENVEMSLKVRWKIFVLNILLFR